MSDKICFELCLDASEDRKSEESKNILQKSDQKDMQ